MRNEDQPGGYHPGIEGADMKTGWQAMLPWLEKMQNAHRYEKEPSMLHRTDMFTHTRRVPYIADHLLYYLQVAGFPQALTTNRTKLFRMGYHHDDPEIITGDYPSQVKIAMTPNEKQNLKQKEKDAARILASTFLNFIYPNSFDDYLEEQSDILEKQTFEAQLIDVADKLDALGETLNELRCGNYAFIKVLNNYRKIFKRFEAYDFWKILKKDPAIQLSKFPSNKQARSMPVLTPQDLHSREELQIDLLDVDNLPRWYRSWTSITLNHFERNPEKFLFPGWYIDLWKRWGIHGQTSHSGILIP